MSRARNIKPSFFLNEQLSDNDPLGRLLFIGLWTLADYKGDLEWKPKTIKIQILPWDDCSIEQLAINLDKSGLIRFYSDGERMLVNIPNFVKHQNPHKNEREKGTDIPAYSEEYRQSVDFKGLTINRDKSRAEPECSHSDPADSLFLNPESLSLNPDDPIPDSPAKPEPRAAIKKIPLDYSSWPAMPSDQVFADWKTVRKRHKAEITQTVIDAFGKELHEAVRLGISVDRCITECVVRGWRGFRVSWLVGDDVATKTESTSTRDLTIHQQLTDRSWAERGAQ